MNKKDNRGGRKESALPSSFPGYDDWTNDASTFLTVLLSEFNHSGLVSRSVAELLI
jgi:hypothetical protein